ncbi:hypothetical protein N5S72_09610 [Aliarcobacter cryaerophilus]|uniref:hypothetical protein n=1 Tax=Aliarcobacter cryaerophilus TaxID=28198 RepID=UPI0021B1E50B|nr:hypothetical protein [Aliarcobacter cryaerophilus]MCT7464704.1 hypothetical protein [Aliarcobacter cryaerophilus]
MKDFEFLISDFSSKEKEYVLKNLFNNSTFSNKSFIDVSYEILKILDSISIFVKTTKEVKTIIDFEDKIQKFSGRGFFYKKDIDTLISIFETKDKLNFFMNQLEYFPIIMKGWLEEEIRIISKQLNINEIHEKYDYLFSKFEIMNNDISNANIKFNSLKYEDNLNFDLQMQNKAKVRINMIIEDIKNPPNINEILDEWVEEVRSKRKINNSNDVNVL